MKSIKVIIALNSVKKRNVGKVIDVLEKRKFTFSNKEDRILPDYGLRTEVIELQSLCRKDSFMQPLMEIFPKSIVERKIKEFVHEHVVLTFETEKDFLFPEVVKEYICMNIYPNPKKRPLMCVIIE
jgi:NDP-sugar pyrophosphorylase family protein